MSKTTIRNASQLENAIENGEVLMFEGENIPSGPQATIAKHQHKLAQPQTVYFIKEETKYAVLLRCQNCGDGTRVVRTSDLHQVNHCEKCTTEHRKERMKTKRVEAREALAAMASTKTKKTAAKK